jgi:hypothetical protein
MRRNAVDAEIAEELRSHIEMAEARRTAHLKFGKPVNLREKTMSADAALSLDGVWRDIKFALR